MTDEDKPLAIDEAIAECVGLAKTHNRRATIILLFVSVSVLLQLALGFFFVFQNTVIRPEQPLSDVFAYLLFGTTVTVFAVLMATHRFHLAEASRMNQMQLGFMRIRVAGRNSKPNYQTEVRRALTEGAFTTSESATNSLLSRGSKVESPLPGHPASDLSAQVLGKVLEKLDISVKAKGEA